MDKKIFVIGAGAAGIAAATKLVSNGFKNLTILEAENRIGGRVHTLAFGANVINMGAQWLDIICYYYIWFNSWVTAYFHNVKGVWAKM